MDVTLFLNHQCNLQCIYCYNGEKFSRPMPQEVMRQGLELAFHGPDARICFFGGEPLLEFGLLREAVAYAHQLEEEREIPARFSITTNGTLLDEEKIAFFRDEHFQLVVSIDGNREAHEATRPFAGGRSSYDRIVRHLRLALEEVPSLETISVLDPLNVHHLPASFESLLELGVKNLNFSFNYEADWDEEAWERLEEAFQELAQRYVAHYQRGEDFALDLFDGKIISHLKDGYSCRDRCKFGCDEVAVAPSGHLYPCERLIGEDENLEVCIGDLERGIDLEKVLAMKEKKDTPDTDCEGCTLMHRCMYWCGCVNYATTGNVGETSGLLCRLEQVTIAAADTAAAALFGQKNPIFIQKFYCAA